MTSDGDSLTYVDRPSGPATPVGSECPFPNFHLLTELGRGSGGNVYLARQTSLANRLVVLKIMPSDETEHLSLARLQHTNIVPLYDVFDDRPSHRRALCMPYFGCTTLFHVFDAVRAIPPRERRAAHLLATLQKRESDVPGEPRADPRHPPKWATGNYADALCHIAAALAQALAEAHANGLLHLDLKPSNVLVTVDGRPMLLDFHLARPPLAPGDAPPPYFGGSPPFMAPEQASACRDVTLQRPISVAVDSAADVYSLGMMLYVGLADEPPPTAELIAHLRERNPQVSVGLADVVARCLAADPADRYRSAQQLAEDLRRHVHSEPLAHVPNRSWIERWRKWRRRRPFALPILILAVAFTSALAAGMAYRQVTVAEQRRSAETMYLQGQVQLQEKRFSPAVDAFVNARDLLPTGNAALRDSIERSLAAARRALLAKQASDIVDAMRLAMHSEPIDYRTLLVLDVSGKDTWSKREALLNDPVAPHDPRLDVAARHDLTELALDWADIHVRVARPEKQDEYRAAALLVLEEARGLTPSQRVIDWHLQPEAAATVEIATPWEWYCLGQTYLRRGDGERAFDALRRAVQGDPADYWSQFSLGVAAMKLHRPAEAVAAFSVCIGQRPMSDAPFVRRGQAFAELEKWDDATHDFDRALQIRPNVVDVLIERGRAHLEAGRHDHARADLRQALEQGASSDRLQPMLKRLDNNP